MRARVEVWQVAVWLLLGILLALFLGGCDLEELAEGWGFVPPESDTADGWECTRIADGCAELCCRLEVDCLVRGDLLGDGWQRECATRTDCALLTLEAWQGCAASLDTGC